MDNLFAMETESAGMQVLESSFIIATSKNIETIKSRQEFLLQRIEDLKEKQRNSQYSACVQLITENYKAMYSNRPLQDYQLSILSNPNGFDISKFYSDSLLNAMKRYCTEQTEEISAMKKETAKLKRSAKVLEVIGVAKNELKSKCSTASAYSTSLAEMINLESGFNKVT